MRQGHSNDIPKPIEYIGLGQWSIRWNVQEDTSKEQEEGITHYVYNEEIYDEEPNYGLFVTNRIRDTYSVDEENALKSNIIESILNGSELNESILTEWKAFQTVREEAKKYGREIFNIV